jgi:hypothetical protein
MDGVIYSADMLWFVPELMKPASEVKRSLVPLSTYPAAFSGRPQSMLMKPIYYVCA